MSEPVKKVTELVGQYFSGFDEDGLDGEPVATPGKTDVFHLRDLVPDAAAKGTTHAGPRGRFRITVEFWPEASERDALENAVVAVKRRVQQLHPDLNGPRRSVAAAERLVSGSREEADLDDARLSELALYQEAGPYQFPFTESDACICHAAAHVALGARAYVEGNLAEVAEHTQEAMDLLKAGPRA